jgi:hypothetical protein
MVELDSLLARHTAWLGGRDALARLQDLRWAGSVTTAGLNGTVTLDETRSGWRRRKTHLGPVSQNEIVGVGGAWVVNFSGQVEPMSAARRETERQENLRTFAGHLSERTGIAVRDLGTETRDERAWRVAHFAFANGDAFDLFLDPADGSCTWIRESRDTRVFWTRLTDWRMVSGVRRPFDQESIFDDARRNESVRWRAMAANSGLVASDFAAPKSLSAVSIAGAPSTPWIDVALVQRHYLFVKGKVHRRAVEILLDSGAGNTVVSSTFAAELGLSTAGTLVLDGGVGEQPASFVRGVDIEIGPLRVSNLTVLVTDLQDIERTLVRPVPIVLGKELFNGIVVDIDYPGSRIAFHTPDAFTPDASARSLQLLAAESGLKLIEVSIEGLPPVPFGLDTGSGSTVTIFKTYTEERRLLETRLPRSQKLARGVGGASTMTLATLSSLSLAGYELRDVPAEFYDQEAGGFNTRRAAGNLGADILNRFRVMLDYGRDRVYLMPGPHWDRTPFRKNRVGIQATYRGTFLETIFVLPGSPAEAAGWTIDERIVAIDHTPITHNDLATSNDWTCGPAGSTIVLTDGSGHDRTLTLANFY